MTQVISALEIHSQLHAKKVGDTITVNSQSYPIRLRSSNKCKFVHVENICFIEQNEKSNSKYGERARDGEKITWIVTGSKWGLICDDSVEETCSVLNEDGELTCGTFVKLDKKTLVDIHGALHDSSQKSITIQGKTFKKTCKNKCNLFEINSSQFIEQNKTKNSDYAKKAKKGDKITWVMVSNVSGFNAHKSWGLIMNGEIEKDCLLFQEEDDDNEQAQVVEPTEEEDKQQESNKENSTPKILYESVSAISSEKKNEKLRYATPVKKLQHKRSLDKSSPSLFSSPASSEKLIPSTPPSIVKCSPLEQVLEIPVRSRTTRRKKNKKDSSPLSKNFAPVVNQ
ncbi:predicted protein [Naegleria gruberi]|uniref:Predicted protein n=1 Tax=Naegleria gruberi TaxID=5762 RepID=D2VHN1_NAEGR|nr:uncharacterized protein NAEGRDRAFT_68384 [Naegleria gruberi]EFC43617.1 predicted protein [Naegleria gruberi]|eukprot:XP_002676361.1 predicted protein [Naegleria gruberi strain NEG-M]